MLTTLFLASAIAALCGGVRRHLNRAERAPRTFWRGRIRLTAFRNRGAAFGLPIPKEALLAGSAVGITGLLFRRKTSRLGAGLVLGGGVSNLAERLTQGEVYDYLQFPKAPGKLKRYVYNLADFAIFFGLLMLLFPGKRRRK